MTLKKCRSMILSRRINKIRQPQLDFEVAEVVVTEVVEAEEVASEAVVVIAEAVEVSETKSRAVDQDSTAAIVKTTTI